MKIDLNLFTVFEAIYLEGSLTRAAERLNLTQPAISHALARLRERLNDPLFVRQGHKMRPTPMAQKLIPDIQAALGQLTNALQQSHEFDPTQAEKTYRIAMRDIMESTLLPPMIKGLADQAPNVQLASVHIERRDMESKLASGELDFAMDVLIPTSEHIHKQKMIKDELVVIFNPEYVTLPKQITAQDYLQGRHILVSTRSSGPSLVDYALSAEGLNRTVALRCQHYFAACHVANESALLLTMPKRYASVLLQHFNNLTVQPLPITTRSIDVYMYWHDSVHQDSTNTWFRTFLQNELNLD
ncbi:LysR family transcriptional regulator [Bermanella sp. R86510]|uniref:LysR family transcriptional regulator n=1 Tax=unclassified Bermanella TaxID=2627862 RepID=UPI0037C65A59